MKDTEAQNVRFYKGLEQVTEPESVRPWVDDEFPHRRSIPDVGRRDFLKMVGSTVAVASLASVGCRNLPETKIVPFVQNLEDAVPGEARHYATMWSMGGYAMGLLVTSHEGRPTKIDGNPLHSASYGASDAKTQAQIFGLYDPDRLRVMTYKGDPSSWEELLAAVLPELEASNGGSGVAFLTETVGSPTYAALLNEFLAKYPSATWHQWEPTNRDNATEGAKLAFGNDAHTFPVVDRADVIVSLDCNFLYDGPFAVANAKQFSTRRLVSDPSVNLSRLYVAESAPSSTGAVADYRLRVKPREVVGFAKLIAERLGVPGVSGGAMPGGMDEKVVTAMVNDLKRAGSKSLLLCGDHQPAALHALVLAMNAHLGSLGETVMVTRPVLAKSSSQAADLAKLTEEMQAGRIEWLFILGGNPVYSAPGDVDFKALLGKVKNSVHLSLENDETGQACTWQAPLSHFLEAWGDGRAFDGTLTLQQPLIAPLYDSKSEIEFLDALCGRGRGGDLILRESWKAQQAFGVTPGPQPGPQAGADPKSQSPELIPMSTAEREFEAKWRAALSMGLVEGTKAAISADQVIPGVASAIESIPAGNGMDLLILPDPNVHDGRFANNPWLQELPKPITNLTWDNALLVSHATAERLGIARQTKALGLVPMDGKADVVAVTVDGRRVEAPVWVNLGQADDTLVLYLGGGRTHSGQYGTVSGDPDQGGGVNASILRSSASPWILSGATIEKTGKSYPLANTQFHNTIDASIVDSGRHIIQESTLSAYRSEDGEEHGEKGHGSISMYNDKEFDFSETNYQWAMTIDLSLCTGCNACVAACQAENNIPAVGKYQVMRGREMHWIRVDRYYRGTGDSIDKNDPPIALQPVTCMQCENAPCEPVCPVAATVHSKEGINQMVYNRCVGTRYCSNNCPYKVRRFNFLNYANHHDVPVLKMLHNPSVTVRGRGVMEKCTFCVQRINHARIEAKKEGRDLRDGEVVTACQQACPSNAIIFGDKRKPENAVSKSRADKRNYILLEETNTRPRVTYLSRIRNLEPELEA